MGLAASQARFLGITLRKANCEYKSTQLAQERLQISNQLSDVSQEYANALNATRLVWNNEAVSGEYGMTYSLLMMPSAANDYDPYLITTKTGAVVLNSKFAAAAQAAGINMAGGSYRSESGRNAFVQALVGQGIVTDPTSVDIIKGEKLVYDSKAGLGATPRPADAYIVNLDSLINDTDLAKTTINWRAVFAPDTIGEDYNAEEDNFNTLSEADGGLDKYMLMNNSGTEFTNQGYVISDGLNYHAVSDPQNITIGDLLKRDYNFSRSGNSSDVTQSEFKKCVTSILTQIAEAFGYGASDTGLNIDEQSATALERAYNLTLNRFSNFVKPLQQGDCYLRKSATYQNNIVKSEGTTNAYVVSLSNMVSTFLTYYTQIVNSSAEYFVGGTNDVDRDGNPLTNFVTDNPYYNFMIAGDGAYDETQKITDFYNELYNNICERGYRVDDSVDQNDYLESTIKDGRYQMAALYSDGYFYQEKYNDINYLVEETDKDAIARAEAKYTQKKAELTFKEDEIDMKSKSMDAEIAELNTELESVKGIISKSIEKTFSMFQN
ncbi:hypothetical protein J6G99_05180 [bacterium]|nr:hypothetical protein [bacterium]